MKLDGNRIDFEKPKDESSRGVVRSFNHQGRERLRNDGSRNNGAEPRRRPTLGRTGFVAAAKTWRSPFKFRALGGLGICAFVCVASNRMGCDPTQPVLVISRTTLVSVCLGMARRNTQIDKPNDFARNERRGYIDHNRKCG